MTDQTTPQAGPAELLICVKCRAGQEMPDDARRPGAHLYDQFTEKGPIDGLTVTPVECLSNCDHGCSVVLRGPGRWTFVYGRFDTDTGAQTLYEGAARYAAQPDGLVPWRERPEHFRKNCIARIPPMET